MRPRTHSMPPENLTVLFEDRLHKSYPGMGHIHLGWHSGTRWHSLFADETRDDDSGVVAWWRLPEETQA